MPNRRSSAYKATVMDLNDPLIDTVKKLAKILNLKEKTNELTGNVKLKEYCGRKYARRSKVLVRGRLGKDNPNAYMYRRGGQHWRPTSMDIRKEHASRFDLYVQDYLQEVKG